MGIENIVVFLIGFAAVWHLARRLYFHPLASYPGPKAAAASNLPYFWWVVSGRLHSRLRELHDAHGDVVRIRPNSLIYRTAQAWNDIYGHRKQAALPFVKDPEFYVPAPKGSAHIVNADEDDHSRQKRLLSHAFSEKSLREQEPLVMNYVDLFIQKIQTQAAQGRSVNLEEWMNFLTFDLIGDLAFGEPFGCLDTSEYHQWVETIFTSIKTGAILRALRIYPRLMALVQMILPASVTRKRSAHYQMSKEKVTRRLKAGTAKPDFLSYILSKNDERGMRTGEIEVNAAILIQAGSETSATAMSACVYYLLTNPASHEKAVNEIRTAFSHDKDIVFLSVAKLTFLNAAIDEGLRLYPPIPGVTPRVVPQGGASIDGKYVPGGVSVSVGHFSTYHSAANFTQPDRFIPERWLAENPFASDKRTACQPFSYGARACIGRNLAYAEMRLTLAKLFWHFDLELEPSSQDWDASRSYTVWQKAPLWVRLRPVQRRSSDVVTLE